MKSFLLLFTLILLITGCGETGVSTQDSTPQAISEDGHKIASSEITPKKTIKKITKKALHLTASATKVKAGESITVSTEKDKYIAMYRWWAESGTLKSDGASTKWTAPSKAGTYNIVIAATDIVGEVAYKGVNITVTAAQNAPSPDGSFSDIKALLSNANAGHTSNVTYICVGDSTRAESHYNGQYLFYEIQNRLKSYNVTSYLLARAGHEAQQFNSGTYPSWRDVVSRTPQNGETTIVDICLGINDLWAGHYNIKENLKSAIAKIRSAKPQTHFVLSMPDRIYGDEATTNSLKNTYKSLARELNLPLNNVVDGVMPSQSSTSYSWYRHDGFNVHMSQSGQHLVAQYILGNMLP